MSVHLLQPHFVPKVWGSTHLEPWYRDAHEKIGEVWYPLGPLLFKFLFTTENLSVQVHPGDAYAREHHASFGKTEMWHVLRAEPDAAVALGFNEPLESPRQLEETSRSGELMNLLQWVPAHPGDTFFVPAGTVHAIGAGLVLCEIQQNSDVTYRLFDYGRDRELHLDHGVKVSDLGRHPGAVGHLQRDDGRTLLAQCDYFATELLDSSGNREFEDPGDAIAVIAGSGTLNGEALHPGQVWQLNGADVRLTGTYKVLFVRSR